MTLTRPKDALYRLKEIYALLPGIFFQNRLTRAGNDPTSH